MLKSPTSSTFFRFLQCFENISLKRVSHCLDSVDNNISKFIT